jgi:hypothetical protein
VFHGNATFGGAHASDRDKTLGCNSKRAGV